MTAVALYPWETVDALAHEQMESELWADVEHKEWLEALFAEDQPALVPLSDPLFTEWWDNGAPSVGRWRLHEDVLPDYQRDDWVGM